MEGTVLNFDCMTTSSFHTSRKEYANLLKCAPFVLGSTFRGAVLDYLLRTLCTRARLNQLQTMNDPVLIADYHMRCLEPCLLKACFAKKPLLWFSFGTFQEPEYMVMTRIGITRDTHSAAEGSIFNVETIGSGSSLKFRIILFDLARALADLITEALRHVGRVQGIGHARSIGFGRFDVLSHRVTDFESLVMEKIRELPLSSGRMEITFTTPFVLGEPMEPTPVRIDSLGEYISAEIRKVTSTVRKREIQPVTVRCNDFRLQPEFVGRFSYERGLRENRLVAWSGSSFVLEIESQEDAAQMGVAAVLGIGPWNDWGFGQFFMVRKEADALFPGPNSNYET